MCVYCGVLLMTSVCTAGVLMTSVTCINSTVAVLQALIGDVSQDDDLDLTEQLEMDAALQSAMQEEETYLKEIAKEESAELELKSDEDLDEVCVQSTCYDMCVPLSLFMVCQLIIVPTCR